mgnify:CR=1 FL=1
MSFSKVLIAASHAIGSALILSLVVPEAPDDVLINDVVAEVHYSSSPPITSTT